MNNSKLKWLIILGSIVGISIIIVWFYNGRNYDNITSTWLKYNENETGISFKYPEELPTEYMKALDWPPQIQVLNEPFDCTEGGEEAARAGQTQEKTIDGNTYCITKTVGAAAGSVYTMYAYAFPFENQTGILTFSTQSPQCANYDDPQKTACEDERGSFDINKIVNLIAESVE